MLKLAVTKPAIFRQIATRTIFGARVAGSGAASSRSAV